MFMPLVVGNERNDWEAYSTREAATWLKQSRGLGEETSKWLYESDFYHRPSGGEIMRKGDNQGTLSIDNGGRRLQRQHNKNQREERRDLDSTFVILDFTTINETDLVEETILETTSAPTTGSTLATPAPTQHPDFTIAGEIFLKGEDMPGGMDGDIAMVSESWRAFYAPVWQVSPPPKEPSLINYNILADANSGGTFNAIKVSGNK